MKLCQYLWFMNLYCSLHRRIFFLTRQFVTQCSIAVRYLRYLLTWIQDQFTSLKLIVLMPQNVKCFTSILTLFECDWANSNSFPRVVLLFNLTELLNLFSYLFLFDTSIFWWWSSRSSGAGMTHASRATAAILHLSMHVELRRWTILSERYISGIYTKGVPRNYWVEKLIFVIGKSSRQ